MDEVVDYTRPSEADEAEREDARRWFRGFGFDGPGALVGEGDVKVARGLVREVQGRAEGRMSMGGTLGVPPPPACSVGAPPVEEGRETEMQEVAGATGFKDYYLQRQQQQQGGVVDPATTTTTSPAAAGGTNSNSLWRASAASLPQSPMLDIVVGQDVGGNEFVVPPMGFNLGHDLGDFLKWEADNVFAAGYYGSSVA